MDKVHVVIYGSSNEEPSTTIMMNIKIFRNIDDARKFDDICEIRGCVHGILENAEVNESLFDGEWQELPPNIDFNPYGESERRSE